MEENNNNSVELDEDKKLDQKTNKDEIFSWIKVIVSALLIALVLRTFVFQMALVNQISMDPTLHEGQMLVISKINYFVGDPQRGHIIVLKDEVENKLLIKRVIGLPGEVIELKNGKVYIDSKELQPDYTSFPTYAYSQEKWTLPKGEYFVLGDNREHSRDSRLENVGMVDRENIIGRAVFRVWPFNKLGVLK
jgi:signal peptidase I